MRKISPVIISIDGPAASGKTTISRLLAEKLQIHFVSSGRFYRALTYIGLRDHIDPSQEEKIDAWLKSIRLVTSWEKNQLHFFLDGVNIDPYLYQPEINEYVSPFSASLAIREWILPQLRALTTQGDLVIEGRDIGSVVFPETPYQFFLTACPKKRKERRLQQGGIDKIDQRDHHDSNRVHAPLITPKKAIIVDTTDHTPAETVSTILESIEAIHQKEPMR